MLRSRRIRLTRFRAAFLLCALLLLGFLVGIGREAVNRRQIRNEISALEAQAKQLADDNAELINLMAAWTNGHQLEKEARLKLGLQKPGENAVLIQREETSTASLLVGQKPRIVGNIVVESEPDQSHWSNPAKWWHYFFQ